MCVFGQGGKEGVGEERIESERWREECVAV